MRLTAVLAAFLVVVAACSSDRGDEPAATDDGGTDTTEAESAQPASDSFGTLDTPCGEGDGGPAGDQGVSDDQVVIGYGDDAGFPASPA